MDGKGKYSADEKGFKIPYYNSRYFLPPLLAVVATIVVLSSKGKPALFTPENFSSFTAFWTVFKHQIPMAGFIIIACYTTILAVVKKLSMIPVFSLIINLYLMTELGITNWLRFIIWLIIGLVLFFTYGRKHSKLRKK